MREVESRESSKTESDGVRGKWGKIVVEMEAAKHISGDRTSTFGHVNHRYALPATH
jgi:hypothetical protein